MPRADLQVYQTHMPQMATVEGVSVRADVAFTNPKGEESSGARKRAQGLLRKLAPALQRVLSPDESVLYALRAQSPQSVLELLTATWWNYYLAACAIVVTNKRILFFPVKRDGSWRESLRSLAWGNVTELKGKGFLSSNVTFRVRDGQRFTYTRVRRADAKKMQTFASVLIPAAAGEASPNQGPVSLCPDCLHALTPGIYRCPNPACGLVFKNEKSMVMRSIFLPGGGYFYTGHPLIAILPAIVEVYLILEICLLLLAGLKSPNAMNSVIAALVILAVFWGIESLFTIFHCRRYVREFIPEKRDAARAAGALAAKAGR